MICKVSIQSDKLWVVVVVVVDNMCVCGYHEKQGIRNKKKVRRGRITRSTIRGFELRERE